MAKAFQQIGRCRCGTPKGENEGTDSVYCVWCCCDTPAGLHSDMYALSWHLTLFSHVLPLQQLMLLWDTLLLQPPTFVHFLTVCILHFLRVPLLSFSPDEESTAIRLLQASFEFVNIPALCAAAVALQNAVPWSLALLPSPPAAPAAPEESSPALQGQPSEKHSDREETTTASLSGHPEALGVPEEGPSEGSHAVPPTSQSPMRQSDAQNSAVKPAPEAEQFFIGEGENWQLSQDASRQPLTESEAAAVQASASPATANSSVTLSGEHQAQVTQKKSASWKTKAIMRVMKGPALILLGAPRKPNTARALQAEAEGERKQ